jgi:hypothetical protein
LAELVREAGLLEFLEQVVCLDVPTRNFGCCLELVELIIKSGQFLLQLREFVDLWRNNRAMKGR